MKIEDKISDIDFRIKINNQEIERLLKAKEKLLSMQKQYPGIHYNHGAFILNDIKDQVSCMALSDRYRGIYARFNLSPSKHNGLKIFSAPLDSKIADIIFDYKTNNHKIKIYDYDSMISELCTSKRRFIKRIKFFLLHAITMGKFGITDDSFNKETFIKLLLLK